MKHIKLSRLLQMQYVPDYQGSSFNPEWLEKSEVSPSAERVDFHFEYAELWNKVRPPPHCVHPSHASQSYSFGLVAELQPQCLDVRYSLELCVQVDLSTHGVSPIPLSVFL